MHSSAGTCRIVTLGCKVNQYESQFVKEALELNGWHEAMEHERADLCLVNTCTVTHEGDAKSRQWIRRLHHANPQARIVVMGCYATRDPAAVAGLPGVVQVITDKQRLPEEMQALGVEQWPSGIRRFDGHQRAFVKVQDGCLLKCSYCVIPSVRPVMRSRPPEDICAEVRELVAGGVQEIVLTGVHLGHYGIDLSKGRPKPEWRRLWHLLDRLCDLPGHFRVRLSSLEAAEARDDLIAALLRHPCIVPHLHLCLQSGSDSVLRRMKRRYTAGGFLERCRRIQRSLDQPALTTDIIVGYPGETEADFLQTLQLAEEVGFARIHIFSYSPRAGTPAAKETPLDPRLVAERRQRLGEAARRLADAYDRSLIGRELDVLVEGADAERPGHVLGTSCRHVPVTFRGWLPTLRARLVKVRVTQQVDGMLVAEPIDHGGLPALAELRSLPLV